MTRILSLFLFITIGYTFAHASDLPADFNAKIVKEMKDWHAPGLGLAIVKDGKTILAKGYGVKSNITKAPVDADTLFQAASTTKAFASMSIAMLIDEGKLNWDDKIIKHIPEFRMGDAYVQNNLTIRDALSHRSGVSFLSNLNGFFNDSMVNAWRMMADNGQQAGFREVFDYNNTTFALSGLVVERISGMTFPEFVTERILTPLGMTSTFLLDSDVKAHKNKADAHMFYEGKEYLITYPYSQYSLAAGMLNSTPNDMAKWMTFLLDGGKWQDEELVSKVNFKEMFTPQINLLESEYYPAATTFTNHYYAYGLAWFLHDYKGHKVAMHTGSINGMVAILGLLPEKNIGVYVFINSDHIEYRHALMYTVFDALLGEPDGNWSAKLYDLYHPKEDAKAKKKKKKKSYPKIKNDQIVGTYTLKGTFPMIITERKGRLYVGLGQEKFALTRLRNNSFQLKDLRYDNYQPTGPLGVNLGKDKKVKELDFWGLKFTKN